MTLFVLLAILILVFVWLWYFAPSGWMTNIKSSMLGVLAAAPAFLDTLLVGVDWRAILTPQNAAIVAGVLTVMAWLARGRSKGK